MRLILLTGLLIIINSLSVRATHVLGGDLTWTCSGGNYIFQLVFYRDCNSADVNTVSENIKVWNHPTVTNITVNFISREDLSPICTEVTGGPLPYQCGVGPNAGNGIGAIEKVIYRSNPIALTGIPPAGGWVFTYENFSRSSTITNLQNPDTKGMTIVAKIFDNTGLSSGCVDNSPQFLQDPYFVSCVGESYEYNMNAVDPDLDSLAIYFTAPLDYMNGASYNPPGTPAVLPFVAGFSFNSPTPGTALNAANIPAQIDASSGNLTFLSNNIGAFVVKIKADSYRQGVLIASVEREMELIVQACSGANNKPTVNGPFAGAFETTVNAGSLVNFTIGSTDPELLQDGSAQSNLLTTTGLMYSSNYLSGTGCLIPPCANLNTAPTISGIQGVSADFSWQTDCAHLVNPFGYAADTVPYHFVFKFQDDYCPIPKVTYKTVTINVVNQGVIQAPQIDCTQGQANGDLIIYWTPVTDPTGSFVEYQIHSVQGGLLGTVPVIGSNSFTIPGGALSLSDFFIGVVSGCGGNAVRYSDTIQNIYLNVTNPSNGTAVLQWNDPTDPARAGMATDFSVELEYPANIWQTISSTAYGSNNLIDTIRVCASDLNYQITLQDQVCPHTSTISGDFFEDIITPDIPIIDYVTIDTLSGTVEISWNQNAQSDTYGYVIYLLDANGIPVELDTVWGISNTTYTYVPGNITGPLSFTVAAFDSCFTTSVPPTYQTSAKAEIHSTMYLTSSSDICESTVSLNWTPYIGWDAVNEYIIYSSRNGEAWQTEGSTTSSSYDVIVDQAVNYCFAVEAVHSSGTRSFSQVHCYTMPIPGQPSFNYLSNVTVINDTISITHFIDINAHVQGLSIQKLDPFGQFIEIEVIPFSGANTTYIDGNVFVNDTSYTYRVQLIDSCGFYGQFSNPGKSILLKAQHDDLRKLNYIYWTPYIQYNGSILGYRIYRGLNGTYPTDLIATVSDGQFYYEDDVNDVVSNGKICYRVEAIEAMNVYGFSRSSSSNNACIVQEPIIYIPNAFMPDGVNKVFMPIVSDFDIENYELLIFSRWGDVIYKTNAYDQGWDGTISLNGNMAAQGTYLYVLTIRDGGGNEIMKRGHVTLLK